MVLIKDLINVQSSYSAQVNLIREFNDRALNVERMSNYQPIKAHRKAFEVIAEGAFRRDSKRCFILSGSYGTGKSHLCLMGANYFETPSDSPEMKRFFDNYSESESNEKEKKSQQLKGFRQNGRYLVCVCDYGSNKFESYILKSLKDALRREAIAEEEMDSYYQQAIRKINEWKTSDNEYFYNTLEQVLENKYHPWTVNRLKEELSLYNKDSMDVFKEIHKAVTTTEFEYDKDNYVEIISQMSNSKIIKEKFLGIVFFYDEFDYQLKSNRFELEEFQKFAQMCAASFMNNFPIIFVATTHRSFASYKNVHNSEDFMTVNDRVKEIPLATEGIEEIISAIINPQIKSKLWIDNVKPNVQEFNQLANECQQHNIFSWLPAPKVRRNIIENIFPMHPLATYGLLKLAEDVGSNNRSVFTFFADEKEEFSSYDWFVKNNKILDKNGELNFYTIELLFGYFKDKLTSDNQELRQTVRDYIRNYETSLRELSKQRTTSGNLELQDNIYERILRVMGIFQIIGIDISINALKFALHTNSENKIKELQYCLKNAIGNKIIYLNEGNQCYEFRRSDAIDINGLINEYKNDESNLPEDWVEELRNVIKHGDVKKTNKFFKDHYFLTAQKYNFNYNEDKRIKREFVTVKELEGSNFINIVDDQIDKQSNLKQSYEGIALHVLCGNTDEISRAKTIAMKNNSNKVMVAIPVDENPVNDEIFSLKAAVSINKEEFSTQDLGFLKDYILQYDTKLKNKLERYIESKNLIYYGKDGCELSRCSIDNDEAAKKLLDSIYEGKRNLIKHEEFNILHEFKEKQNVALKEAVEKLLDFSEKLYYRNDVGADRGDTRYFHKVLVQTGIIRSTGTNQNRVYCEIEMDSSKYQRVLPALASMIKEIKEKRSTSINLVKFSEYYIKEYGIGYNALIIFFAIVKRYFKDSLTIIAESGDIGSLKVTTYDTLLDLLYHKKYRNAVIQYKEIHEHDKEFIKKLDMLFTSNGDDNEATIDETFESLKQWFQNLDEINKIKSIYDKKSIVKCLEVFERVRNTPPREFILEEIKTIYGYDRQDLILTEKVPDIIDNLKKDKEVIEQGYCIVRDKIVEDIKNIFNITKSTHDGIYEKINNWYENLSDFQQSYNNEMQSQYSKQLVLHLGRSTPFEELLTEVLPKAYDVQSVKQWTIDKSITYVEKIRSGKKHIEENVFLVTPPTYECVSEGPLTDLKVNDSKRVIKYRKAITLKIIPELTHSKVFITSNESDPKKETSQREEVTTEFNYQTSDEKIIKFCGVDNEGRYSKVITIELLNEDKKFEVKYVPRNTQLVLEGVDEANNIDIIEDPKVQVTLPKDKDSLKQCIHSIIGQSKVKYGIKEKQLIEVLEGLIKELRR